MNTCLVSDSRPWTLLRKATSSTPVRAIQLRKNAGPNSFRIVICTVGLFLMTTSGTLAKEPTLHVDADTHLKTVAPFLKTHCVSCHSGAEPEAGLKLDDLNADFVAGSRDARAWHEIMDRLNLGEMPPDDEPRPKPSEVEAVNAWILGELRRSVATSAPRRSLRKSLKSDFSSNRSPPEEDAASRLRTRTLTCSTRCRSCLTTWKSKGRLTSSGHLSHTGESFSKARKRTRMMRTRERSLPGSQHRRFAALSTRRKWMS